MSNNEGFPPLLIVIASYFKLRHSGIRHSSCCTILTLLTAEEWLNNYPSYSDEIDRRFTVWDYYVPLLRS